MAQDEAIDEKTIDLSRVQIAKINAKSYKKLQEQKTLEINEPTIFDSSMGKNTNPEKVKELQIILSRLSYYTGDIDGKYSKKIEDALYDFQLESQLVVSRKNLGAGFYGVKTRAKLQEIYTLYTENEKKRVAEEARLALVKAEQEKQKETQRKEVTLFVQNLGTPKADEVGVHIRNLQQSLKSLGYFNGKDTAIFGKNTRAALVAYQTEKKVGEAEFGKLGKSTKEALFKDLLALKEKQNSGLAWNGK